MANNDEAGSVNGGRRGLGRGIGADEPPTPVLWPCSLIVLVAYQVAAFNLLVPPDCRLPGGWKISAGVRAIPPLLVGADLENTINSHHNELSEEDRNNTNFAAASDLWPALLTKERLGPVRPPFTTGPAATLGGTAGASGSSQPPSAHASYCLRHATSQRREYLLHRQGLHRCRPQGR
jgi:hypothetical protein